MLRGPMPFSSSCVQREPYLNVPERRAFRAECWYATRFAMP